MTEDAGRGGVACLFIPRPPSRLLRNLAACLLDKPGVGKYVQGDFVPCVRSSWRHAPSQTLSSEEDIRVGERRSARGETFAPSTAVGTTVGLHAGG